MRAPRSVRIIGWCYVGAAALGTVGGVLGLIDAFRTGAFSFAVPVSVGMSAGAIGRGLLAGRRTAWKWARGLAVVVPLPLAIGAALVVWSPVPARLTFPGGSRSVPPGDLATLGLIVAMQLFFCWQFVALSLYEARTFFGTARPAVPLEPPSPPLDGPRAGGL